MFIAPAEKFFSGVSMLGSASALSFFPRYTAVIDYVSVALSRAVSLVFSLNKELLVLLCKLCWTETAAPQFLLSVMPKVTRLTFVFQIA